MEEILGALDNDILDELDALKNIHDWALISNLMAGKNTSVNPGWLFMRSIIRICSS